MTILKSQINSNDPDFIKNKQQLNVDFELTLKAVNTAITPGSLDNLFLVTNMNLAKLSTMRKIVMGQFNKS